MSADADWLDALAGRIAVADAGADAREALALRLLIRQQDVEIASTGPPDAAREDALIERAQSAGLLSPKPAQMRISQRTAAGRRPWLAGPRGALAAAAVVIVAVGFAWLQSMLPPKEMLRGMENGTVHLTARDPPALKRELIDELDAAGAHVVGYVRLGRAGIDADLPQPLTARVRQVLDAHHIPIPKDGVLLVEIEAPDTP